MRLSPDIIAAAPAYINAVKERELSLRGLKFGIIENLGVTHDQYESIDMSENELHKLDGFPLMNRLLSLLCNNNRITKIAPGLGRSLAKLQTLILSNNKIANLSDIDPLNDLPSLTTLSLINNPVAKHNNYRLYVIYKLPLLRVLDFHKIKPKEREASKKIFGEPAKPLSEAQRRIMSAKLDKEEEVRRKEEEEKAAVERAAAMEDDRPNVEERRKKILEAIQNASSLEEVERLEKLLQEDGL